MRSKSANTQVSEKLLVQLWIRNLPETVRAIVTSNDSLTLEQQSTCADKIQESIQIGALQNREINAISNKSDVETKTLKQMESMIDDLKKEIKKLTYFKRRPRNRSQTPNRSNSVRSNSNTSNAQKHNFCWYHGKFGSNATKCVQPCEFDESSKN